MLSVQRLKAHPVHEVHCNRLRSNMRRTLDASRLPLRQLHAMLHPQHPFDSKALVYRSNSIPCTSSTNRPLGNK